MTDYPYMISNNKIAQIIQKLQQAAKPSKFTIEVLKNLGFTSTNDRAFIPLFKKLGFFMEDGTPNTLYDQLRDKTQSNKVLAQQIRNLYSELFAINTEIFTASEGDIKGAISRVTGKDEEGVTRIYNTFKALCAIADFSNKVNSNQNRQEEAVPAPVQPSKEELGDALPQFHYNIQIHLPATTDISVYNAIFKSLKENLLI